MKYNDLGVLDGSVVLFGGPYSNAHALQALHGFAQDRGIEGAHMICTGDVVAYCGDPLRTVHDLRAMGCAVIAGNCDVQLGSGATDCGCGFEEGSSCDLLSVSWFRHAAQTLGKYDKEWMSGLPDVVTFHHQGARYGVLHGGVNDVAQFIWSTSREAALLAEWEALEATTGPVDHIIAGHCGIPFIRQTARGRWINAGVIGMPPHDGRQQTRFALLDGGDVQIHRLDYDVGAAAQAMQGAGLPDAYRRGLITGYWPSEDVLPPKLRLPSLASG